jgi:hypothetical protein
MVSTLEKTKSNLEQIGAAGLANAAVIAATAGTANVIYD